MDVPADAKIFVNDRPTTSEGTTRSYVSRGLKPGVSYSFEVRAEMPQDGKTTVQSRTIKLTAGSSERIRFHFGGTEVATDDRSDTDDKAASATKTTLKVNLPSDAKLVLAGNATRSTGSHREFSTTRLQTGASWNDYVIRATVERNGQLVSRERVITLQGGAQQEITLDFESADAKLASLDR